MKHTASLFIVLAVLWWILSGYTKLLIVSLGLASVAFTVFVAHRLDVIDEESHPLHLSLRLLRYWLFLLQQIVIANIDVIKTIISPRGLIDPRILSVPIREHDDLGKVVLGNSITLTPGTVTLDINDAGNEIIVHAINKAAADDVRAGTLDKRIPRHVGDKSA